MAVCGKLSVKGEEQTAIVPWQGVGNSSSDALVQCDGWPDFSKFGLCAEEVGPDEEVPRPEALRPCRSAVRSCKSGIVETSGGGTTNSKMAGLFSIGDDEVLSDARVVLPLPAGGGGMPS